MIYLVCNHEWSFLEGEKKHSHTLKAGRHLFPFQLQLGGSLPSTLYAGVHGGASVTYKLRAVATRPGFAHNLQTQKAVTLLRSFAPEAFEYQQLLEIENTWPEKIMYSIMVPHKAWAAGDALIAVVKLSPLAKGVRILNVVTTLNETTKVRTRTGWQESTKQVVTTKHEFRNGQAVCVEPQDDSPRSSLSHQSNTRMNSGLPSPDASTATYSTDPFQHHFLLSGNATSTSNPGPSSEPSGSHSHIGGSSTSGRPSLPQAQLGDGSRSVPVDFELSEEDIVTKIEVSLPASTTPTHPLDPIVVSHRVRWNILLVNLDGHNSELRCSLPLHILDYRLLDEARSATTATRQLLLGRPERPEGHDPDMELPSYPSHIRDRIANMYLPDQATLRVTNSWVHQGISPVQPEYDQDGRHSGSASGTHTPALETHYVSPSLGYGDDDLEYVNSELTLSLSQNTPPPIETHREVTSPPETTPSSQFVSRRGSRAASPERERDSRSHSRRSSGNHGPDVAPSTYLHANSKASHNVHSLVHVTMKPLTSLSASFALPLPTRHHVHAPSFPNLRSLHQQHQQQHPGLVASSSAGTGAGASAAAAAANASAGAALPRTIPVTSPTLLHRAFTEVPDYDIASRGFLGGVTPLETLQGLPSYEEAEMQRSHSESDLVSMTRRSRATPPTPRRPFQHGLSMTTSSGDLVR